MAARRGAIAAVIESGVMAIALAGGNVGIAPRDVTLFVVGQLVGTLAGIMLGSLLFPNEVLSGLE